jgi:carbonic anhydrase
METGRTGGRPGRVLGLEPGEAVMIRNIGGRITPAALRSLALPGRLGQGQPPAGARRRPAG